MARALARHAANVAKANPWPTTSGAVTTIRAKGPGMGQEPREGGSKAGEGSGQVIAYTGVIHPLEAALTTVMLEYKVERDLAIQERDEARATIARMRTGRP